MTGAVLALVAVTLVLLAAGVGFILFTRGQLAAREEELFHSGRELDATLQLGPGAPPSWLRVNLRDGCALVASVEAPGGLSVRVLPVDRAIAGGEDGEVLWRVEREGRDDGLSAFAAIYDRTGARTGGFFPGETHRLGWPLTWTLRDGDRALELVGAEIREGEQTLGRRFRGPYPRIGWLQWSAGADEATRRLLAFAAMLHAWSEALWRHRALWLDE